MIVYPELDFLHACIGRFLPWASDRSTVPMTSQNPVVRWESFQRSWKNFLHHLGCIKLLWKLGQVTASYELVQDFSSINNMKEHLWWKAIHLTMLKLSPVYIGNLSTSTQPNGWGVFKYLYWLHLTTPFFGWKRYPATEHSGLAIIFPFRTSPKRCGLPSV